jgi:hypothetical protein
MAAVSHTPEASMFGIAAIVSFALSLILWLAGSHINGGVFLTWQTFTIAGLLLLAVHVVVPGWPRRGTA